MTQLANIQATLQKLKPELVKKYHIRSIGLFGSLVRNDFTATSDVDIIVDFTKPIGIEFIDLAEYLEKVIHKKVDLVSKAGIKQKYFETIESEIVYV